MDVKCAADDSRQQDIFLPRKIIISFYVYLKLFWTFSSFVDELTLTSWLEKKEKKNMQPVAASLA